MSFLTKRNYKNAQVDADNFIEKVNGNTKILNYYINNRNIDVYSFWVDRTLQFYLYSLLLGIMLAPVFHTFFTVTETIIVPSTVVSILFLMLFLFYKEYKEEFYSRIICHVRHSQDKNNSSSDVVTDK